MTQQVTIVVPFFNEADRFDETPFLELARCGDLKLLLVNDGSTDATGDLLAHLASESELINVLTLEHNGGKGEAVRRGLLRAISDGADVVGYYDADAATPPDQMLRLVNATVTDPRLAAVFGSRVARLGSTIRRSPIRHYAGRVYATLASLALGMEVYDTQCGAKVFRVSPSLISSLSIPFPSQWTFDVWLIHRLISGSNGATPVQREAFVEIPLDAWRDVGGSKMRPIDALKALIEISQLIARRARWQRSSFSSHGHAGGPNSLR